MAHSVLVVEDSRAVNDLVVEALSRHGFSCTRALDGFEALKRFEHDAPDALVLDLNIPKLHGLEVLRHVKRQRPYTVVVVLTGHGSEQTAMQALKLGADDYLTKPFREANLVASLQEHLGRADLQKYVDLQGRCPVGVEDHYLARVFYDAPAALVHVGPDGVIRGVNRAAARLLARSPEALLGQPAASVAVPGIRDRWMEALRREAATARGYEGEVYLEGVGGPFPASVVAVERPEPGNLILALRDLTRQKEMEKRYFASKRLASLGRVVEGVAHEVRNPLISIGGFARKLQGTFGDGARENRYVDVIVAEVERLEKMVRDIEEYVQFSSERRPHFARVEPGTVVARALAGIEPRARADGVEVRREVPGELPFIYADPVLLEELFAGLLENACEAMPGGGRLAVQARAVDNWVQVRVEDTGRGIAEEDLEEIFDPFYTSKTTGAGLGLAKAYLVVEDHSGTIDFESRVGKGTVCTVSLPVERRRVPRGPG